MLHSYNFNTVNPPIGQATSTLLFPANPRRISLNISATSPQSNYGIIISTDIGNNKQWGFFLMPYTGLFTYRDFGQLIRESVYVWGANASFALTVIGAEIYTVG
jgi:hypothetical protein